MFFSPELNVNYKLVIENNMLIAYSPKKREIVFKQKGTDLFESDDRYFRTIQYSRNDTKIINGLHVTDIDGRVRNLWFEKK
jgi:hypothetical protein